MPAYTFTDESIPGYPNGSAEGINNEGQALIEAFPNSGGVSSFLVSNGSVSNIDVPNSYETVATDINDSGTIVGFVSSTAASTATGYMEVNGSFSAINIPNAQYIDPRSINNLGQVIGDYRNQAGNDIGFIEYQGGFRDVNVQNSTQTFVQQINNSGIIAGVYRDQMENDHGFIDNGGAVTTIDYPGASATDVQGINNSGEVIGTYLLATGGRHSFTELNGSYTDVEVPGAVSTSVDAINNLGEIAGFYTDGNNQEHGFVEQNGVITTVDDPNNYNTYIFGINDKGEITGEGVTGGFRTAFVASLTGPSITGTVAGQTTSDEAPIAPFSTVTISDPNNGAETLTITLAGSGGTLSEGTAYTGPRTLAGGGGTYKLTGTAAQVTAELDALRFTPTAGAPGAQSTTTFTLTDVSSASSGSGATDSSTTVVDTAAPGHGTGSTGSGTQAEAITFDPTVHYLGGVFTLGGHASSPAGVTSVEIAAQVDGTVTDLGAATVNADGSFSFADRVGPHTQGFITATETDGAGGTAQAGATYSLTGGLDQHGFRALQTSYTPDGSAETATTLFRPSGSQSVDVQAPGQTLASGYFDTFQNNGAPESTFVFDPGYGLDVVRLFRVDGADHDTLSFKGSDFGNSIADVLNGSHFEKGGVVITDPTSGDQVKLTGITKAQLVANQQDFAFHA